MEPSVGREPATSSLRVLSQFGGRPSSRVAPRLAVYTIFPVNPLPLETRFGDKLTWILYREGIGGSKRVKRLVAVS